MATIMDIILSTMLGGTLLLITLTTNEIASESASMQHGDVYVQESMIALSRTVESELRNMGFGVADTGQVITQADSTSITYLVDLQKTGKIDTVRFFLGPTTDLLSTPNELDRFLYRQEIGKVREEIGIVTRFRFRYLKRNGDSLTVPVGSGDLKKIHEVETTMEVQNPFALQRQKLAEGERDALYSTALWKQTRLAAQNLKR
jgi:hypothetical protein